MIRQLILIYAVLNVISAAAQQTVYTAHNYQTFIDWTFVDEDGDGFNWEIKNRMTYEGLENQGDLINSFSLQPYNFNPLTPDNYAYSIPINCAGYDNLSLRFKRLSTGVATKHEEKYSVYAINGGTSAEIIAALDTATPLYTETIEVGRVLEERTVDFSMMAGMDSVYIVFRHYDCSDQFFLTIDDVVLESFESSASASTINESVNMNVYPQPMTNSVNISSNHEIASISLMDQNGKIILLKQQINSSNCMFNTEFVSAGVYILKIETTLGAIITKKCVK